jgi:hypothetical protein
MYGFVDRGAEASCGRDSECNVNGGQQTADPKGPDPFPATEGR